MLFHILRVRIWLSMSCRCHLDSWCTHSGFCCWKSYWSSRWSSARRCWALVSCFFACLFERTDCNLHKVGFLPIVRMHFIFLYFNVCSTFSSIDRVQMTDGRQMGPTPVFSFLFIQTKNFTRFHLSYFLPFSGSFFFDWFCTCFGCCFLRLLNFLHLTPDRSTWSKFVRHQPQTPDWSFKNRN